ncbi:hypothetical protein [Helicobacter sp. MIT 99-5507]|uniref:hypothetical protein n=1 Tax=Helicobacter sp. MIT 99-5507 TaxID=152489 RepID=UPI0015F151BD|nr:hypothetical protein [Helicobacter sp. MIT 99-5507]
MSDNFEEKLDENILKIKECQKEHSIDTCFKCELIVGCKTRKEYVDSVYSSMNKGSGGFFNFETE